MFQHRGRVSDDMAHCAGHPGPGDEPEHGTGTQPDGERRQTCLVGALHLETARRGGGESEREG